MSSKLKRKSKDKNKESTYDKNPKSFYSQIPKGVRKKVADDKWDNKGYTETKSKDVSDVQYIKSMYYVSLSMYYIILLTVAVIIACIILLIDTGLISDGVPVIIGHTILLILCVPFKLLVDYQLEGFLHKINFQNSSMKEEEQYRKNQKNKRKLGKTLEVEIKLQDKK